MLQRGMIAVHGYHSPENLEFLTFSLKMVFFIDNGQRYQDIDARPCSIDLSQQIISHKSLRAIMEEGTLFPTHDSYSMESQKSTKIEKIFCCPGEASWCQKLCNK
jgi:hypothetical protein